VPIRGSLLFLFGVTALYLLTTLSSGLLISTVSTSQQQALLPVSSSVPIRDLEEGKETP
jgi:ABC-type transport system involved in multi-copper enzyme maturation permease subunit